MPHGTICEQCPKAEAFVSPPDGDGGSTLPASGWITLYVSDSTLVGTEQLTFCSWGCLWEYVEARRLVEMQGDET